MTDCVAGGKLLLGAGVGTGTRGGGGGGGAGGAGLLQPVMDTSTSDEAVAGGCSPPRGLTRAVRTTWWGFMSNQNVRQELHQEF